MCCTLPSKSPTTQQFYFKPVTTNAVQKCISKMHGNKFFGVDKIPFKIYKDCLDSISFSLTDIFNKYSQKCISPEKMALKTSLGIDYIDQSCAFTDQSFSTSYGLSTLSTRSFLSVNELKNGDPHDLGVFTLCKRVWIQLTISPPCFHIAFPFESLNEFLNEFSE